MKDSLGNILTKEQEEFFKNSKIRDNNNNLLVVYHGSDKKFDIFKNGDIGFHFGTLGQAEWITKEKRSNNDYMRQAYAGTEYEKDYNNDDINVEAYYLNITHPATMYDFGTNGPYSIAYWWWHQSFIDKYEESIFDFDMTKEELDELNKVFLKNGGRTLGVDANTDIQDDVEAAECDHFNDRYNSEESRTLRSILKRRGYDGIVYVNNYEDVNPKTNIGDLSYIAFEPNQIKKITNKNPSNSNNVNEKILESLLLEKTRQDLISKSKKGRDYSPKNQARGKNRWERRRYSQIANSVRDYNNIDMDSFWKGDILDFKIKVHGETDDYVVSITFEKILDELQREVKANNNKLEFKCVLRALLNAFNGEDVYLSCTCKDWIYRFSHYATIDRYNAGIPEMRPNRFTWTNSQDDMGSACKHVNLVLSNTDWMMKIASVINNYIKWCKDNMGRNYADYIFPKVYGMPYNRAVQLSIFDDPEDNGLLPSDQDTLNQVIDKSLRGKDERGRWVKDNEFRFQKKERPRYPEDDEDQLKLDIDNKEANDEDDKELNIRFDEKEKNLRLPTEEEEENG